MNNHEFANGVGYGDGDDRTQPCVCGKWWWHEEHFGGDKGKAVMAFEAFVKEKVFFKEKTTETVAVPPKFSSVEEADEWMAERRRVLGIPEPEERLTFASQEEADDWLRQQAGELFQQAGEPYWKWRVIEQEAYTRVSAQQQAMARKMDQMIWHGVQTPQDLAKGFSVDVS